MNQLLLAGLGDLFASLPPGFSYRDDAISPSEERGLVAHFETLPFKPFEFHGHLGKRRVVYYGHRYDYGRKALEESAPLPDFLAGLRGKAAAFAGLAAEDLSQALVTEYAPGAGIGWHRDRPMFRDVIAFSFLAPCTLRLRRRLADGFERRSRLLAPQSVYLLRGDARWDWEHSIPEGDALRYSVTFRNFVAGAAGTAPRAGR
jgi:alkylated DNA repair dioxygenase AlkB